MDVRAGLWREPSAEELMLLNCGVGEDSWESLGVHGDPTSPSQMKSVLNIQWKDWCCSWSSSTLATWWEELTHWKRPWCWERLGAGGEGDDRGWDGWMASPTQWTWVWINSGSWWWTGRPGVLRFMGLQRVGHDWATELNWTEVSSLWGRRAWSRLIILDRVKINPLLDCDNPSYFEVCKLKWLAGLGPRGVPVPAGTLSEASWCAPACPQVLRLGVAEPASCCGCPVTKSCLIPCHAVDCSMPVFLVLHYLPEFARAQVHWVRSVQSLRNM